MLALYNFLNFVFASITANSFSLDLKNATQAAWPWWLILLIIIIIIIILFIINRVSGGKDGKGRG